MKLSPHQVVYLLHAVVVGPLLAYVGLCGKKCPQLLFTLLLALGLGVIGYHTYLLVRSFKEGFIHPGGYLGRPEPFVPFSYPYNVESERYYSMHDTQHNRGCNCTMVDNCDVPEKKENTKEGFMLPNFGMKPVVPEM